MVWTDILVKIEQSGWIQDSLVVELAEWSDELDRERVKQRKKGLSSFFGL